MALISIIEDFQPLRDERLLLRASELKPELRHEDREPVTLPAQSFGKGESFCLDFGEHLVGRITLELSFQGSHPDAPAFLRLRFAETLRELDETPEAYQGWLSQSWIQEEILHVDLLPTTLSLERRYAFRYLRITVLDTSPKYRLKVLRALCRTENSADWQSVKPPKSSDALLCRIHVASVKTLADCMQEVLEDGPKRDRRLWMGDLRLQALTNAVSFRNFDLVKRCLYLFGGSRFPDGRISANIFDTPEPEADDTFLFDYAMMFVAALEEYLRETGDEEALRDLYDIAMAQIDYGLREQEQGLINARTIRETFIDWSDTLDKTACAAGVLLYALGYALKLAERKGDREREAMLLAEQAKLHENVMLQFWDAERGCFVSKGQISAASQVWMVLAGAGTEEQQRAAMEKALTLSGEPRMTTPYMHHYFVMALLSAGLRDEAERHLKAYWGGMLSAGADTFFECWDPEHPDHSPYGGLMLNSFCHAWSCTPAWFLRSGMLEENA